MSEDYEIWLNKAEEEHRNNFTVGSVRAITAIFITLTHILIRVLKKKNLL